MLRLACTNIMGAAHQVALPAAAAACTSLLNGGTCPRILQQHVKTALQLRYGSTHVAASEAVRVSMILGCMDMYATCARTVKQLPQQQVTRHPACEVWVCRLP
jgi:hypothetical protein